MPTARLRTDSINLRLRLLAAGRWVTLMRRSVFRFMPSTGLVRALPIELPTKASVRMRMNDILVKNPWVGRRLTEEKRSLLSSNVAKT